MTIRRSMPLALTVVVACGVAIALLSPGDHSGDMEPEAPRYSGPLAQLAKTLDRKYDVAAIAERALPRAARPVQPQTKSGRLEPTAGLRFDLPGTSDAFVFLYDERTEPKPGGAVALIDAMTSFYGVSGCGRYVWFIEGEKESPGEDWIGHVGKALASDRADCQHQWSVIS